MTNLARPCRCQRPVRDDETCLRCGRALSLPTTTILSTEHRAPRCKPAWTHDRVVRALKAFAFFRGRPPAQADWSRRMGEDWPSLETVVALFGSVRAANVAADVERPRARAVGE